VIPRNVFPAFAHSCPEYGFSKAVRNSVVIPAQAGIHAEYANYGLHFHLVGYEESTSGSQYGFPLSRERRRQRA